MSATSDIIACHRHAGSSSSFAISRQLYWFGVNETALVAGYAGKR
jgi:hypothetical protein